MSKKGGFLKGMFLGTVIGGITALLFSPKSGKELREELKNTYTKTKAKLDKKVAELKPKTEEAYKKVVGEILEKTAEVKKLTKKDLKILKDRLESTWHNFKKQKLQKLTTVKKRTTTKRASKKS